MRKIIFHFGIVFITVNLALFSLTSCKPDEREVEPDSPEYRQAVSDFYISLGASQTDEARFAFDKMGDVTSTFPDEAAAWANLGVLAMRQGNYTLAEEHLGRALELKPENPDVIFLASILENIRGNIDESVVYLRRGTEADPTDLKIHYALAQELERQDDVAHADEIIRTLEYLHDLAPENQVVLLELARMAAKEQDEAMVGQYINELSDLTADWQPENREQLEAVYEVLEEENFSELILELSFLRNMLQSQPVFQDDLLQVQLPPTDLGFLVSEFLNIPQPEVKVAAPDLDMTFEQLPIDLPEPTSSGVKSVTLSDESPPFPISITNGEVVVDQDRRLDFPGNTEEQLPVPAVTVIDYNYNFRNDLAVAGSDGFRLYRLNEDQSFTDVTGDMNISNQTINRDYYGVWALDVDMDGDLDILLAPRSGTPLVLRNNGDGTFTEAETFSGLEDVRQFLWADLTGDGPPEAVFLTADGSVSVFENLRGGRFDDGTTLDENVAAIAVADLDADGHFNVITVATDGTFLKYGNSQRTGEWEYEHLIDAWDVHLETARTRLFVADLDNNGAFDLILSTADQTALWLGDENRQPVRYDKELSGGIVDVFDLDGNERLDLLGVTENLEPFHLKNAGTKGYFAQFIQARASGDIGDQRINSFGIGGEMEVRSGLLYQKQLISSPNVHFGLGEYDEAQMLRIIWPNGSVQAQFAELGIDDTIFDEQILKGSCPYLFAGDGEEIHFITDAIWRSPLGLRINAQETAGVIQTLDRVRIPGDKLNPVDGLYDLRITAELWETHFFDYISLLAVDHPEDTEIFVDERFVFPPPDLSTRVMSERKPVARITDDQGNDVTELLSKVDGSYLQAFEKTAYQGLAREHSIEIELESDSSEEKARWLVMTGWLRPTDSSINLALSQGSMDPPRGLKVEVPDASGGWSVLHDDYGMPAGKIKTILLDLEDAFPDPDDQRVRLTTTSEIYWDGIFHAEKRDESLMTETKLEAEKMELRFRGYSEWNRADSVSPKLPDYSHVSGTNQRWRDLEGFHTRFGDVSELLEEIDDRYVIMNAGDEIALQFHAPDAPREGYTRSYVLVADGWVKDGDYNTEASATVDPLPYHGQADYEYSPTGDLQNDPVFQEHREDWIHYHTRYITPHLFRSALLFDE